MSGTIGIIGAGMAGLSAALSLHRAGCDVICWEAGPQPGGVVRSERSEGYQIEHGPNTVQASSPTLRLLIEELGLGGEAELSSDAAKDRYIWREGSLRRLPAAPPGLLTTKALSPAGKLALLREPWQPRLPQPDPEETVRDFCIRRLGREAADYLVDPFVSGIYAGDPARLEVAAAFPALVKLEQEHGSLLRGAMALRKPTKGKPAAPKGLLSFRGGLSALPHAMAAALDGGLHLGCPVQGIEQNGDGWMVVTAGGTRQVSALVLATPAAVSAGLLERQAPQLATELRGIPYAPIAVVHLGYPVAAFDAVPHGFGVLIPRNQRIQLLGALFISSLFPDRAPEGHVLLTCFIGGFSNSGVMALDDANLLAQVESDLARTLPLREPQSTWQRIIRWERAIPQYVPGHSARLSRIRSLLAELPGLHLTGNWREGISLEAAASQGRTLAESLLET